jgi:hypothetical protein
MFVLETRPDFFAGSDLDFRLFIDRRVEVENRDLTPTRFRPPPESKIEI